jgi:hypothetical protein
MAECCPTTRHAEATVLDKPETIDQNAQRWAELMKLVGLRGHVFADAETTNALPAAGVTTPTSTG